MNNMTTVFPIYYHGRRIDIINPSFEERKQVSAEDSKFGLHVLADGAMTHSGKSSGIISWLKLYNQTSEQLAKGGQRVSALT